MKTDFSGNPVIFVIRLVQNPSRLSQSRLFKTGRSRYPISEHIILLSNDKYEDSHAIESRIYGHYPLMIIVIR